MSSKASPKLRLDETVCSAQDVKALALELREYGRWFSHNEIKKRVHAHKTTAAPILSPAASALLRQQSASGPLTQATLDKLLKQLADYEKTAPQLTITLAAPPAASLKRSLVGWCRDNLAADALVNFQFSSAILGGLVVRTGSHVYDWSFRRQILAERGKFPEVLRRV